MEILTPSKLNDLSHYIVNNALSRFDYYGVLMQTLLVTGCRVAELHYSRWYIVDNEYFGLLPQKANNTRIIPINTLNPRFINYIYNPLDEQLYTSYSSVLMYFNRALKPYKVSYERKDVGPHLFRHNFIRQLYAKRHTFDDIKDTLGYKSNEMLSNYLYTELHSNY
jgi:integrase